MNKILPVLVKKKYCISLIYTFCFQNAFLVSKDNFCPLSQRLKNYKSRFMSKNFYYISIQHVPEFSLFLCSFFIKLMKRHSLNWNIKKLDYKTSVLKCPNLYLHKCTSRCSGQLQRL